MDKNRDVRRETRTSREHLPRILVTSGEPAGIGPDLCIAIAQHTWSCELVFIGDRQIFAERARQLGVAIDICDYDQATRAAHISNNLCVMHVATAAPVRAGQLDTRNATAVLRMLDIAAEACMCREFDAVVTAPVQKSVINDAGIPFWGHTEYLAEKTGSATPVMMLVADTLRVALVTTHIPLTAVSRAITAATLEQVITVLERDLRQRFSIAAPRILVCGLNPHAGEGGHLGREEIEVIAPTLAMLRQRGLQLIGPTPADTAFTPHMLAQADCVLAMYHDQGLTALKYAGFGTAVNITLGLPIIRTSVDHGTALDLAGTGKADAGSLIAALKMALELTDRAEFGMERN